jgi:dolichyl-phosphate beta-glucosyltransferase
MQSEACRLRLSIVVPAFNESARLEEGIDRFNAAVGDGSIDLDETEVILVDDGSSDTTSSVAAKLLAPLPHHRILRLPINVGKGAAVRAGVRSARGEAIAYMDADMAIDPRAVPMLLDGLIEHDIVVGCRALTDSKVETTNAPLRILMGLVFNRLVTAGTGLHLRDTQCGCKAFRAPVAKMLFQFLSIDRFAFDVELLLRAHQLGMSIAEVPVHWKHVPGSTIQPMPDSLKMMADVLRLRLSLLTNCEMPAVEVSGPLDRADLHQLRTLLAPIVADGSSLAVVEESKTTLVFPMLQPPEEFEIASKLRRDLAPHAVIPRLLHFGDLAGRAPLTGDSLG